MKFWAIFQHEYRRHVLRKRFLLAALIPPLWLLFAFGVALLGVLLTTNRAPVGYVDQAGLVRQPALPENSASFITRIEFIAYPGETQARAALDAKNIQAYLVIPADYAATLDSRLVYSHAPSAIVETQIGNLLRLNLLAGQPPAAANRVLHGASLVIQAEHGGQQTTGQSWVKTALPIIAAGFLMFAVFTTSGYLMNAVVEEKENRTMELLATSATPNQIMAGKISALILVGMTQVLAWSLFPALGLLIVARTTTLLQGLSINWGLLGLALLTALPTFILIAALMAAIGASITESREGQQVSTLVTFPVFLPFLLTAAISMHPNSPLALALSFFPLTASITLLIRLGFTQVPAWQIALSTALLALCAGGSLWLAGRIFRAGMLRYGHRMAWRETLSAAFRRARGGAYHA